MPSKTPNDLRFRIIRTMIDIGTPVAFNAVKKGAGDKTDQLVYYHLQQLVKEGLVLFEDTPDGRVYSLQPIFYETGVIAKIGAITEFTLSHIEKGLTSPEINSVQVYLTLVTLSQMD